MHKQRFGGISSFHHWAGYLEMEEEEEQEEKEESCCVSIPSHFRLLNCG